MKYDDAFTHYKDGTANDEEKEFVEQELAKARALVSMLDDDSVAARPAEVKRAEAAEVKEAKKQFSWHRLMIGLVAIIVLLVAVGAVLGGVFGAAGAYAKNSVAISSEEAVALAIQAAYEDAVSSKWGATAFVGENNFRLDERPDEVDRKFVLGSNIKDSYYVYEIDVKGRDENGVEWEYEIDIDARSGGALIVKVEWDREGYYPGYGRG